MGYAGFSRGVVLLTTCMNLAIFLSGFIAQVAPTAAFDHLQRLFPQFSGWLLCHGWTITPKKRSILGLTSLLSPSFTHSPSSNSHLFKNHLQVATKTTGGHSHQKNQRIPWKFQGTSRFSMSLAIWVLWDLRSFFLKNIEFQRIQNSEKPWCWWAVCFARSMGMFLLNIKGFPSVTKYRASLWLGWRLTWKTFKTFDWQYDVTILSNICWDEKNTAKFYTVKTNLRNAWGKTNIWHILNKLANRDLEDSFFSWIRAIAPTSCFKRFRFQDPWVCLLWYVVIPLNSV